MDDLVKLRYYGWSAFRIETNQGSLLSDPFFRPYCDAEWFHLEDFSEADYICVTHGHDEHFMDIPVVAKTTGATVVASQAVCDYLVKKNKLNSSKVMSIDSARFESVSVPGFKISVFPWKHRDINIFTSVAKQLLRGSTTQLAWAWNGLTKAPFYAPFTGYHYELPNGVTILNYGEGFNTAMTDVEIRDIGSRFRTDILLAGMQLYFMEDVARGVAALKPKIVVLYPPHEKLFNMLGAKSAPWTEFAKVIKNRFPNITVHIAEPGFELPISATDTPSLFVNK